MVSVPKLGPTQQDVLRAALSDGSFRSGEPRTHVAASALNARQYLSRDKKDGNLWYPTDKARADFAEWFSGPMIPAPLPATGARLPHHPLAGLFPMFSPEQLRELADDIASVGQQEPVWLLDGQILDGRNREAACFVLGIAPWTKIYEGTDPLGFVLSLNLHRRHLSDSQRAMVAAKLAIWKRGINQHTAGSANLPTHEVAKHLSVSERQVIKAKRVDAQGIKELSDAIRDGRVSLHAGETISLLEGEAQREILRLESKELAARVKDMRTEKMAASRATRTSMINLIADRGRNVAGEMPVAAFALGYCDFPWEQGAWSNETGQDKGLSYPSMSIEDGMALCAGDKSPFTRNAKLYFWTTTNRWRHAIRIIEAWDFEYVSAITWDKVHIGMGREVRDRTEHLLICKRGDFPGIDLYTPKPESLYSEIKREHSRKPVWFAEEIERLHPDMRKLELFQRRESLEPGDIRLNGKWSFWGFESGDHAEAAE
jgi:N6-adenosine-specific RNA methylase IME4/ParB-like chromosome segregation protein Spo0J